MTEASKQSEKKQLLSLRDFIEANQRLIAVIGVFVALALFWKVVLAQNSAPYISYLCLLTTIPLIIEINRTYRYEDSSWNLVIFVSLLWGILAYTAYYLLVGYPDHLQNIINGLIFATLTYALLTITIRFFNAMRTNQYERDVEFYKRVEESGLAAEQRNEFITKQNKGSRTFYRLMNGGHMLVSISVIVTCFFATAAISNYVRAANFLQMLGMEDLRRRFSEPPLEVRL